MDQNLFWSPAVGLNDQELPDPMDLETRDLEAMNLEANDMEIVYEETFKPGQFTQRTVSELPILNDCSVFAHTGLEKQGKQIVFFDLLNILKHGKTDKELISSKDELRSLIRQNVIPMMKHFKSAELKIIMKPFAIFNEQMSSIATYCFMFSCIQDGLRSIGPTMDINVYWTIPQDPSDKECDDRLMWILQFEFGGTVISNDHCRSLGEHGSMPVKYKKCKLNLVDPMETVSNGLFEWYSDMSTRITETPDQVKSVNKRCGLSKSDLNRFFSMPCEGMQYFFQIVNGQVCLS